MNSMSIMDKLCAVVDAQGFYLRNKFFPREVAFVSDNLTHCQEFNPNIPWNSLTEKEAKTIRHVRSNINGLSLNTFKNKRSVIPNSDQYIPYLKKWYPLLASDEKQFFGVKNKLLYDELVDAKIPVVDLSDPKFLIPSVTQIEKFYESDWLCAYHCRMLDSYQGYRCALRKCHNVWNYLKEIEKANKGVSDIKMEPDQ